MSRVRRGIRSWLRRWLFSLLRRVANTDEAEEILYSRCSGCRGVRAVPEINAARGAGELYAGLGKRLGCDVTDDGIHLSKAVFVSGRFRSGSTLLWNLFRHIPEVTSYYEPFNERRWFDRSMRGAEVDRTHLGVSDYWAEYDGLAELGSYFQGDWKFRQLYMGPASYDEPMQRYIESLIDHAPDRAVLQFNEVDFRLGWLKAWFPEVPIIHIVRQPRDQWCSTLLNSAPVATKCLVSEFPQYDGFYLLRWARDLRHTFPFLSLDPDNHAYELFYQVWRLSHLFGQIYADLSVRFEDLVANPAGSIRKILDAAQMPETDAAPLVPLVSAVRIGKWREYASEAWFSAIETRVDQTIMRYAQAVSSSMPRRTANSDS